MPRASRKTTGMIPQVAGFARGDARFRIGDFARQLGRFRGRVVTPAGLLRELLQQLAVLRSMEILRHAVLAAESQHVAARSPPARGRPGSRPRRSRAFRRVHSAAVDALFQGCGASSHGGRTAVRRRGSAPARWRWSRACIPCRALPRAAARACRRPARLGRGGSHLPGRVGHQVTEDLLPERRAGSCRRGQSTFSSASFRSVANSAVRPWPKFSVTSSGDGRRPGGSTSAAPWRRAWGRPLPGNWPAAASSSSARGCARGRHPAGR